MVNTQLQKEVYDRLTYINGNFIEERMRGHPLFGGAINDTFSTSGNSPALKFVNAIFGGYSNFAASYSNEISTSSLQGNVYYRDVRDTHVYNRNGYKTLSIADLKVGGSNLSNDNYFYGEVNMSKLLADGSQLKNALNTTRILYSLMDPVVYQQYLAAVSGNSTPSFKVHTYALRTLTLDSRQVITTELPVNDAGVLEDVKDVMFNLMTANNLIRTKDIVGSSNLSVVTLSSDQKTDQGISTSDTVISLETPSAVTVAEAETSAVMLKGASKPNDKLSITFKYKMKASTATDTGLVTNGQLRLVVKNATDNTPISSVVVPASATWETFKQTFDVPASKQIAIQLVNLVGTTQKDKKKILVTDMKATLSANWRELRDETLQQPVFQDMDVFVARRLLRLYELCANMMIAGVLMEKTKSDEAKKLGELCYNMLVASTADTSRDVPGDEDSIKDLTKLLSGRINTMKSDGKRIDELDKVTSDFRMTLKAESEKLERRRALEKKAMTAMYITLAITMVVSVLSMAVYFAPMEKPRKLSIIGMAFAVAILAAVTMNLVYNKQIEGFYVVLGSANQAPAIFNSAINVNKVADDLEDSSNVMISMAADYLDNTINVAYMLGSYRSYGNINSIMGRERNIFESRATQMNQTNLKLKDANNVVVLSQNIQKARISFFTNLAIIISLTIAAVLLLDNLPGSSNVILGVAGVIIFILTIAYFMDTSGRVNTSGEKYYWGQPDVRQL